MLEEEGTLVVRGTEPETYVLFAPVSMADKDQSIMVRLEIAAAGLRGAEPELYLDVERLGRFLKDFVAFEERRTGTVTLKDGSLDEFTLSFNIVDSAGHAVVRTSLKRYIFANNRLAPCRMFLQFELDPTSLPAVISGLRKLLLYSTSHHE